MYSKKIDSLNTLITNLLSGQRLREAFAALNTAAVGEMMFDISDRLKQLEQTYAYMLKYLTEGARDPERKKVLNDIISGVYHQLDLFTVAASEKDTPSLYFNVRRFNRHQQGANSVEKSLERWQAALNQANSMSSLYARAKQTDNGSLTTLESAETGLFNSIWTSFPLLKADAQRLVEVIDSPSTQLVAAVRFVSALGLAAQEFQDSNVLEALCDIYTNNAKKDDIKSRSVCVAALVWLISALYKYSVRKLPISTLNRLEALTDLDVWNRDVRLVFMELVRSRDTERINRAIREDIIPGMMALKPEIESKIKDMEGEDLSGMMFSDNPEWEEMLAKSGIEDKLKEFNDMQMDGSDVFMGTFSHLKNFPFFNDVVNWFTPLTEDNPQVDKLLDTHPEMSGLVNLICQMPFLCDSDKFSMLLSVDMVPKEQLQLMLGHLAEQNEQMMDLKRQFVGITDADRRKADIRNYVHNLYRFVNLYRRKDEFYNIFSRDINLLKVNVLKDALMDPELLNLIGEFYFKHKYYSDSLAYFEALDRLGEFDATLYQKMGYACEKTGNIADAIKYYEQADLLDGNSRWTKLRLAGAYRLADRMSEATEVLKKLNEEYPDDAEILLMMAFAYISADNYREALKHLYKLEFLENGGKKMLRAIAWSLFMIRDFERSHAYYNKILVQNAGPEDYLNMGHVELARANYKEAINYYKLYINAGGYNHDDFFKAIENDRSHLQHVGISDDVIRLIVDAVLYNS